MIHASSLVTDDWDAIVARLGGAEALETGARLTGAFLRPRKIRSAVDLLRFTLAYCLGEMGLRLTAAWGAALGLADVSNVALLGWLRTMEPWLARLVGETLQAEQPAAAQGRLIRVVDATTVPQAGARRHPAREAGRSGCGGCTALWTCQASASASSNSPTRAGASGSTAPRGSRARAGSLIAPPLSRTAWRPFLTAAGTCWCGQDGTIYAGSTREPTLSTS